MIAKREKKKRSKKNSTSYLCFSTQFSDYYNFMSELIKKMKQRIRISKDSAANYKFRRPKELIHNAKLKASSAARKGRGSYGPRKKRVVVLAIQEEEEEKEVSCSEIVDYEEE